MPRASRRRVFPVALRTVSGIILVLTFIMFAYNVYMTVRGASQQQAGAGLEPVA